jgi:hypothetical protein
MKGRTRAQREPYRLPLAYKFSRNSHQSHAGPESFQSTPETIPESQNYTKDTHQSIYRFQNKDKEEFLDEIESKAVR